MLAPTEPDGVAILLLEDHVLVREGIRALLEQQDGMRVVAEASTLQEAEAVGPRADVIVADLNLPDARGADVVERLRRSHPDSAVLVLTMVDDALDVQRCLASGARGYLIKDSSAAEVVEAVRRVAAGGDYVQPALGAALARWREVAVGPRASAAELTPRERDVLRLIALGHTNTEAATVLYLSVRTVENHRSSIMRKLRLRTRADLVRYAHEIGLVGRAG
jgi:two-component system response regulator NreC